jgi:hypothetical protein
MGKFALEKMCAVLGLPAFPAAVRVERCIFNAEYKYK